jgi:hypothetical protein
MWIISTGNQYIDLFVGIGLIVLITGMVGISGFYLGELISKRK